MVRMMKKIWKNNKQQFKRVSEILNDLLAKNKEERLMIREIENYLGERGFGIMMLIFSLPLSIPIPLPPGFTTIAAIPLIIFSVQMIFCAQYPWLPKWLSNKSVKQSTLLSLVRKANIILTKMEKFSRPRLSFLSTRIAESLLGVFLLLCSIAIANPIPFTNFLPALSILTISFGLINQDGVIICCGISVGILGLILTFFITILGPSFILHLF